MLIKTLIFNCHDCMLKIQRDLVYGNRKSVGTWCCQFTKLIAVPVVQKSRISQR